MLPIGQEGWARRKCWTQVFQDLVRAACRQNFFEPRVLRFTKSAFSFTKPLTTWLPGKIKQNRTILVFFLGKSESTNGEPMVNCKMFRIPLEWTLHQGWAVAVSERSFRWRRKRRDRSTPWRCCARISDLASWGWELGIEVIGPSCRKTADSCHLKMATFSVTVWDMKGVKHTCRCPMFCALCWDVFFAMH